MSKAILILDEMPKNCGSCDLCMLCVLDDGLTWKCEAKQLQTNANDEKRPKWCPLKYLPDKLTESNICDYVDDIGCEGMRWYQQGWNDAIERIGGDT